MPSVFALLASVALAGAPSKPTFTNVSLQSADGHVLAASLGVPKAAKYGVVLVHQGGRNKEDWLSIADKLYGDGVAVIAVDLRGHGASAPLAESPPVPADYAAMVGDVRAAIDRLEAEKVTRVAVVGAELGANLGINAALDEDSVAIVAMLSPGLDYKGVITSDAVKRYGGRTLLIVAASDDTYGAKSAAILDGTAQGIHEFRLLESGGRGMKMLSAEPALEGWLVGWIGTHWSSGEAAPARAVPAIPTTPLSTSAPAVTPPPQ